MADRVSVVARFQVQADKIDAFIEAAQRTMVEPTQGEKGCIRYQLWQDLEDPTKFSMLEEWESEEDLSVHLAQESLQQAVAAVAPMAAGPVEVQRLRNTKP